MKKIIWLAIGLVSSFIFSVPAGAISVTPTEPKLADAKLIISEVMVGQSQVSYVQIFNRSTEPVQLSNYKLDLLSKNDSLIDNSTLPSGYLEPSKYILLASSDFSEVNQPQVYGLTLGSEIELGDKLKLSVNEKTEPSTVEIGGFKKNVRYGRYKSSTGNFTTTETFSALKNQAQPLTADFLYYPRENFNYDIVDAVYPNSKTCPPGEDNFDCSDYIKLANKTNQTIDLSGTRLRFGNPDVTASASNTILLDGILNPGDFMFINKLETGKPLSLLNSGGFVWLEDSLGTNTYKNTILEVPDASNKKGLIWARFGGEDWNWGLPSFELQNQALPAPNSGDDETEQTETKSCAPDHFLNPDTGRCKKKEVDPELKPCLPGQERNPETGRCRKIVDETDKTPVCAPNQFLNPDSGRCKKIETLSSTEKTCASGQFLNPETGRCRKITSDDNQPKPCPAGQERNPDTGRCRKIATLASAVKPCPAGQERNPETNRCRKILAAADNMKQFKPEIDTSEKASTLPFWIAGAVAILAIGRTVWEFRGELKKYWLKVFKK